MALAIERKEYSMGLFSKKEPEEVQVCDKPFKCVACGNQTFWRREAQLNTAIASFFHLDWLDESATCVVCSDCGYVHWFVRH